MVSLPRLCALWGCLLTALQPASWLTFNMPVEDPFQLSTSVFRSI
uniref:CD40 antigen n=1 Tax=Mus musculus TaxID=10090 RepID=S4R2M8_MOUSE